MPRDSISIHDRFLLGTECDSQLARQLLDVAEDSIVASGRRGRLESIEWQGCRYARKVYLPTGPASLRGIARKFSLGLLRHWRWRRAFRSWRAMEAGVPIGLPLPIPWVLDTTGEEAVLISSWTPGEPIHHWVARCSHHGWRPSDQFRFCRWIGSRLLQVLSQGFDTRDLAPHNVLVSGPAEGPWELGIVDLDDATVGRVPSRHKLITALAQVGHLPPTISASMRMRAIDQVLTEDGDELLGPRRKAISDISNAVTRMALSKKRKMIAEGRNEPFAGWGLGADGLPLPFSGAAPRR